MNLRKTSTILTLLQALSIAALVLFFLAHDNASAAPENSKAAPQSSEAFGLAGGCTVGAGFVSFESPCGEKTVIVPGCSWSQETCKQTGEKGQCVAATYGNPMGTVCEAGSGCKAPSLCGSDGSCIPGAYVDCAARSTECETWACAASPGGTCALIQKTPPIAAECQRTTDQIFCGQKYWVRFQTTSPARCGGAACPEAYQMMGPDCPPVDCQVSDWIDPPNKPTCGTYTQYRTIIKPAEYGGLACPALTRTIDLGSCAVDCKVSAWVYPSPLPTCGSYTRVRSITQAPQNGGAACPALTEVVTLQGCPVDCLMDDWQNPSPLPTCGSYVRTRAILRQPANGGAACGATSETVTLAACPKCTCNYELPPELATSPDLGMHCDRLCMKYNVQGYESALSGPSGTWARCQCVNMAASPCPEQIKNWDYPNTPGGSLTPAYTSPASCIPSTLPPPVDCVMSAWTYPSPLPSCGYVIRTRTIITPASNGGAACGPTSESFLVAECVPPVDCKVSDWSPATAPVTCGTYTRTRTVITPPSNGGAACPSLVETVNLGACPVDCIYQWVEAPNAPTCGTGTKQQNLVITQQAANGGVACPTTTTRMVDYSLPPCPGTTCSCGYRAPYYDSNGATFCASVCGAIKATSSGYQYSAGYCSCGAVPSTVCPRTANGAEWVLQSTMPTTCAPPAKTATSCAWAAPGPITYGAGLPASLFDPSKGGPKESSGIAGSFRYSHSAGTVLGAGTTTLTATFQPTDTSTYESTTCTTSLTVSPAQLVCRGRSYTRNYGYENGALAYDCSGFVNGDTYASVATADASFGAEPTSASAPGTYQVQLFAPSVRSNYTVKAEPATITVKKQPVTCRARDFFMTAGSQPPAQLVHNCTLMMLGQTEDIFGPAPLQISGRTDIPGRADVVYTSPITHENYLVTTAPGNVYVTSKTATACSWGSAGTITYGTGLAAALFDSNLKGAKETSGIAGTFTYSHTSGQVLNAGTTTMTATFTPTDSTTYAGTTCTTTINVKPAALTCTGDTLTREYGSANPTIGYSCNGFVGSDTKSSFTTPGTFRTGPAVDAAPGTYSVDFQTAPSGNTNYSVTPVAATLTVTKKAVTCRADDKSMFLGRAVPALTHTCSSLALSDTQAIFGAPSLVVNGATDVAGVQGIIYLNGITHANYVVATNPGVMTVSDQVATSCSWAAAGTIVYGTGLSAALFDSAQRGARESSGIAGRFVYSHAAGAILNAGTTVMTATFKPTDANRYQEARCTSSITVKPASLSCSGGTYTRAYGESNPTFISSCTGWVSDDTVSAMTAAGSLGAGPATDASPGVYSVAFTSSPAAGSNYSVTTTPANVTVIKKGVTCVADNKSMMVNGTAPQLTHTCTGLALSQSQSVLGAPSLTINGATNTTGTQPIIYTSTITHPNYTVTTQPGLITVTGKTPTSCSWAAAGTITYGTGLSAALFDSNQKGARELNAIPGNFTYSHSTGQKLNAGTTTMIATFNPTDSTTYEKSTCKSIVTVTPLAITCSGGGYSRAYGDANPTFQYTCEDLVSGKDYTSQMTTTGVFNVGPSATAPAGTAYAVGYTTLPSAGANYTVTATPANITIQRKAVTCTVASYSRPYGQANPTLTTSSFNCSGFVSPDTQSTIFGSTVPTTAAVASSPVGSYPITMAASMTANYSFNVVNGVLTVGGIPLTCTGSAHTRQYGAANPSLSYVCKDSYGTDYTRLMTTSGTFAAGPTASAPPAAYDVPFSTAPSAGSNYTVTTVPGKITVTKKVVSCTVGGFSRFYATANPTFSTASFSCFGFLGSDTTALIFGTIVPTTTATTSSNVGNYPVTLAAPPSTIYQFAITDGTLTVVAPTITCWGGQANRAYGAANPSLSYQCFDPFGVNVTQSMTTAGTFTSGPSTTALPATYDVAFATEPSAGTNYTVTTVPAKLTVTKASVGCNVANASRAYNQANPTFAFSCSGFVSPDTKDTIFGASVPTTTAVQSSAPGSYPITLAAPTHDLYTFIYINSGTLTVSNLSATCTGSVHTREYGAANPTLSYVCKDSAGTDLTSSMTGGTFADGPATSVAPSVVEVPFATAPSLTGYTVTTVPAKITISKKAIACQVNNATKQYGAVNPTFTTSSFTCDPFVSPDTKDSLFGATVPTTTATTTSAVGTYPITIAPPTSTKYSFTLTNGTLTVLASGITCTGSIHTRVYGAANPTLSFKCLDSSNRDMTASMTTQGVFASGPSATAQVGIYHEVPFTTPPALAGYTVTTVPAKIYINKKPIACTVKDASRLNGVANPTFTKDSFTCDAFVSPDTKDSIFGARVPTVIAPTNSTVSSYPITLNVPTVTNYTITVVNGTLTITNPVVTCRIDNKTRAYGVANPAFTWACSGFISTDATVVINITTPPSTTATQTSLPGDYPITMPQPPTGQFTYTYTWVMNPGTLTVQKITPTCSWTKPADMKDQDVLSSTQLNARVLDTAGASITTGAFTYNPAAGKVMTGPATYTLSAAWSPAVADSAKYNTTSCTTSVTVTKVVCGDNAIGGTEDCDGTAFPTGRTPTEGYRCNACALEWCGDGKINGTEECDGAVLPSGVISGSTCTTGCHLNAPPGTSCTSTLNTRTGYATYTEGSGPISGSVATACSQASTKLQTKLSSLNLTGMIVVKDTPDDYYQWNSILRSDQVGCNATACVYADCQPKPAGCCWTDYGGGYVECAANNVHKVEDLVNSTNCTGMTSAARISCLRTLLSKQVCTQLTGSSSLTVTATTATCASVGGMPGSQTSFTCNSYPTTNAGACGSGTTPPTCNLSSCPTGQKLNTAACQCEPTCGNGVVDAGETCDVGNGGSAGCQPGAKCVGCQLRYDLGGCRTMVVTDCSLTGTDGTYSCIVSSKWGSLAVDAASGSECVDQDCCPGSGSDASPPMTFTTRPDFGCMKFSDACPNHKGMATDPPGFKYTVSPGWHSAVCYDPSVGWDTYDCLFPANPIPSS